MGSIVECEGFCFCPSAADGWEKRQDLFTRLELKEQRVARGLSWQNRYDFHCIFTFVTLGKSISTPFRKSPVSR